MNYSSALIHQIYEIICFSINEACKDKNCLEIRRDVLAFGFTKSDSYETSQEESHEVYALPVSTNIKLNLTIKVEKIGHDLLSGLKYVFEFNLMSRQKIMMQHCNYYIQQIEIMSTKLMHLAQTHPQI